MNDLHCHQTETMPNIARGDIILELPDNRYILRPSFAALVAAEEELGALFALVERAANGQLSLAQITKLFWYCLIDRPNMLDRDSFGEELLDAGLAALTPALKAILHQILQGRSG